MLATVSTDIHKDIIEQCKSGVRQAQYKLYKLYAKAMFNIVFRMLNNREEAEDILQDVFVEVFNKLESFRYESTFGAWLKQIVINRCINFINKKRADLLFMDDLSGVDIIDDDESIDEEALQLSVEKVKWAMNQLPEGGRIVFSLYLFEGYDHGEIAEILSITESTSKTQYMRAKQRVKELLKYNPYEA